MDVSRRKEESSQRPDWGQHRVLLVKTPTESISGSNTRSRLCPVNPFLHFLFFLLGCPSLLLPTICLGSDAGTWNTQKRQQMPVGFLLDPHLSLPFANLQWLIIRISSHTSLAIIEDDHHSDEPELTDEDI
jgi:hypothetical protein